MGLPCPKYLRDYLIEVGIEPPPRGRPRKAPSVPTVAIRREPGVLVCSGVVEGRAVPWKAPNIGGGDQGRRKTYKAFREWKGKVNEAAVFLMGGQPAESGPVWLEATFYIRKAGTNPDVTNLLKSFEDGLQGPVYVNDTQVCGGSPLRVWTEGPERVEFRVVTCEEPREE